MRVSPTPVAAALVLGGLVAAGPAPARELGRLFFTPEQRLAFDELRRDYAAGGAEEPAPQQAPAARAEARPPPFSQLTINGVVLRSQGMNSTWINGARVDEGTPTREGIRVDAERTGQVRIRLPSGVDTIELKPGQKIDVATGAVLEPYQYRRDENAPSAFDLGGEGDGQAGAGESLGEQAGRAVDAAKEAARDAVTQAAERLKKLLGGE